jgi:phage terminase small subunit
MERAPLTARQARFVEEYLIDGNGTAAAIRAGYAAAGAHVTASRTLRDPKVAERIRVAQAETRAALKIDQKTVIKNLQAAFELARAQSDPAAMVAAAREIGRLLGLYEPVQHAVAVQPSMRALAVQERLSRLSDAHLEAIVAGGDTPG